MLKRTVVITISKPGKGGDDPVDFRPIYLLSVVYIWLERLILERIQPAIDRVVPVDQAGFTQNGSCNEQLLALSTLIESGAQKNLKTSIVQLNLSAAIDTIWRHGLLLKFISIISCLRLRLGRYVK